MKYIDASYKEAPCYPELVLALLTGIGHVAIEVTVDGLKGAADALGRPQHVYNFSVSVLWSAYILWRLFRTDGAREAWGSRAGGFSQSLKQGSIFAVLALVPLLVYGKFNSRLVLPPAFLLVLVIYPVWGIVKQFALQAFVARN